jgi:hypothetical protein
LIRNHGLPDIQGSNCLGRLPANSGILPFTGIEAAPTKQALLCYRFTENLSSSKNFHPRLAQHFGNSSQQHIVPYGP